MKDGNNIMKLVISVAFCELAGVVGSFFTALAIQSGPSTSSGLSWYATLAKPALNPPAWLLAPYLVWVSFAVYLNYAFWILNG